MNPILTNRSVLTAALLWVWAGAAPALSLGPVSGSTVIGRPLEVSVPVRFDDLAAAAGSGCVSAELLYGDKAIAKGKVKVELAPDGGRPTSVARISSPEIVDEPVVTVVLQAGCRPGQQSIRRYVLLADAPRDEPVILGAASSLDLGRSAEPSSLATADSSAGTAAPRKAVKSAAARTPDQAQPQPRVTASTRDTVARQGGRLQLALWEPGTEKSPWLRASTELRSAPSADGAQRAAATALWRALNAQPQDLLRTAERLRGLEAEISSLRSLSMRHRTEIYSARESLQATQSQRHTGLALAALLALLTGGGAAYFWNRSRRPDALASVASWYPDLEPQAEPASEDESQPAPMARSPERQSPSVVVQPEPVIKRQPPVMQREVAPQVLLDAALEFTLPEPPAAPPPPVHVGPGRRGLKVDALHGAQQQSEFFVSLGQFDEAVAVLAEHIHESGEKPVLAFLELFRIYHALGMPANYEEVQSEFRRTFDIDFTSYSEYKEERRELETYPTAVARLSVSWPSAQSQEMIEELLFKKPASARDLLSLEACRELVWLYSLGQDLVYSTGAPAGLQLLGDADLPNNHFILPWAAGEEQGPPELSLDRLSAIDVAPDLNGFGVDIDLTALPETRPQDNSHEFDAFDAVMESASRKH